MRRPWLSHYDYWVPPSVTYPERPLWEILDAAYVDVPDRVATVFLGATLTYRDALDVGAFAATDPLVTWRRARA